MVTPLREQIQADSPNASSRAQSRVTSNPTVMEMGIGVPNRQLSAGRQSTHGSFIETVRSRVSTILTAPEPKATFGSTTFNLIKNMMGAGILSLPSAFKMGSIIPSTILFFSLIAINSWTMMLVATLCHKYKAKTYRELWSKVIGTRSAPVVDCVICFNSFLSGISYCLLIGDWLTQGLSNLFGPAFGFRVVNTLVAATFVLFPLSMMRDLHALRHTSVAGVCCSLFAVCFVVGQTCLHWSDKIPTRTCEPIRLFGSCTSPEVFEAEAWHISSHLLTTLNVCASPLLCHYNIPKMYAEFAAQNLFAFGRVVVTSLVFVGLSSSALGIAGLLRFGSDMPPGNILGTFRGDFPPAGVMSENERVVTLFAYCASSLNIAASFPLLFSPLRQSFLQLRGKSVRDLDLWQYTATTVGLVAFVVFFGLVVPNLILVQKIKGAICGMSMAYIFPGILLWGSAEGPRSTAHVVGVVFLLTFGSTLMMYGISENVVRAFAPRPPQ